LGADKLISELEIGRLPAKVNPFFPWRARPERFAPVTYIVLRYIFDLHLTTRTLAFLSLLVSICGAWSRGCGTWLLQFR
jgi:hypothetical protein